MSRAGLLRRLAGAWRFAPPRERAAALSVTADELPPPVSRRLHGAVSDAVDRAGAPGAQIVVRRGGSVLWAAHAGTVNGAHPVRPEDRFVLASTTKPVIATLIGLLAQRGALDLDAPVATWLPELPNAGRLTARQLLAQRSGLREYAKDPTIARRLNGAAPEYDWTRREIVEAIARLGPERDPGERFAYRNSNYVVAAELAERAGGRDVETLLAELVTGPLQLRGFSFERSAPHGRLSTPHAAAFGRTVDLLTLTGGRVPNDAIGPVWGDGGIASSAGELARFTEALFACELVAPRTLGAMVSRASAAGRKVGYGLGVMTMKSPDGVVAGHDGMYYGWSASTSADDRTGTTVSVLTNLAGVSVPAARIARAARAALRHPAARPRRLPKRRR